MWRPSASLSSSSSRLPNHNYLMEEVWNDISIPTADLHHSGVTFQDFFSKEPPPAAVSQPPPTPAAVLTTHHHFRSLFLRPNHRSISPTHDVAAAAGGKKRFPQDSDGDCRHNRMMKNRVSAARSRFRKQAYTNELELQVANLRNQNAILKEDLEQLHAAAAGGAQQEKKKTLHRISSAPLLTFYP